VVPVVDGLNKIMLPQPDTELKYVGVPARYVVTIWTAVTRLTVRIESY